jgi:ubiquinone/menaquinone biosynthesis C-methylase UbiE
MRFQSPKEDDQLSNFNYMYMVGFAERYASQGSQCTILDYGCGAGEVIILGRQRGLNIFGADVYFGGSSVRPIVEKSGMLGTIIREISAGKLDFPDQYFDLVLCNQVLEHVEELDEVLFEVSRVLKPGGTMLSLFPSLDVWREGHCGIPFLHRFSKSSRFRYHYALWLRRIGLGSHKNDWATPEQWTKHKLQWLDSYCHYRDRETIEKLFTKYFSIRYIENDYLVNRLNKSWLGYLSPLVKVPLLKQIMMEIFRKLGGLVILAAKLPENYSQWNAKCL